MTCPFGYGSALTRLATETAEVRPIESSNGSTAAPGISEQSQLQLAGSASAASGEAENMYYRDYLSLKTILHAQHPASADHGNMQHDEMLFIIIHQTYELWFKQILHELCSVHEMFSQPVVTFASLQLAVARLKRVGCIQTVMLQQMEIMDTMTPMAFLEFRDYVVPASGFQSVQFRIIEVLLGIPIESRRYGTESFLMGVLDERDRALLAEWREKESLVELVNRWLSRIPFFDDIGDTGEESWPDWYHQATKDMLDRDEVIIRDAVKDRDPSLLEDELKSLRVTRKNFESLFNIQMHEEMVSRGARKMSQKATLAAIFISLYRDRPVLSTPFQFLQTLIEMDRGFSLWRYRHAAMAHRQVGTKMGTGGTSGAEYLMKAANENSAFKDLWNLSSFLIPLSAVPKLSENMERKLGHVCEVYEGGECEDANKK
eukprot:GEMP01030693.1.p1 GENE.GEMP01030693.1~~GEMP01030693.1.p1  ORF type:complete len:431 (+),score=94.81 GEMP01030693.1:63-1355(+)